MYVYDINRQRLARNFYFTGVQNENMLPAYHFMSGVAAGMMASILTQPADVVKTHMQIGSVQHKKLHDTIVYIYQVSLL